MDKNAKFGAGKNFAGFFCVLLQILKKFGILNIWEQKTYEKKSAKKIENEENLA